MERLLRTAPLLWALLWASCTVNPLTERKQLILLDRSEEVQLGRLGYQQMLAEASISTNRAEVEPLQRVARRIAVVAEEYVRERGVRWNFDWEFAVIRRDDVVNAVCLPGGKVAVYTGLYPVCHDEDGLAVVVGHEVAHALARHGAERLSQHMLNELGGLLVAASLSKKDKETIATALAVYGIVGQLGVLLPYSRDHESEADRIGLVLAARAGYDPRAGIQVWERMKSLAKGGGPEFLSTHPSHDRRIRDMEKWMPEMLALFQSVPRAPNFRLPAPGGPAGPPTQIDVAVTAGGVRASRTEDGVAALEFAFSMPRDAFLEKIRVAGPGALFVEFDAGAAVTSGTRKAFHIRRSRPEDPPLPAGDYLVSFVGKASGVPFASPVPYRLR